MKTVIVVELECAVARVKAGKAAEPDKISLECMNVIMETYPRMLLGILNKCLMEQSIPTEWTTAIVVLVPKEGGKGRFRTICIIIVLCKIVKHLIKGRLISEVEMAGGCS